MQGGRYLRTVVAPDTAAHIVDPRIPYYFFNQASATNPVTTPQDFRLGYFVSVRFGSTGTTASANNSEKVTLPGLYPIGGRYDDGLGGVAGAAGTTVAGKPVVTGRGVVAQRLHTYFGRKYTEAELQLTVLNNNAAATTAFREALVASFDKVNAIASADFSPRMDPARVTEYIEAALAAFNKSGASADDKLEVLMYEKYVASFGYGIDMYTDFRRTYHPRIKVPGNADPNRGILDDNDPITQSNGAFPRRLYYSRNDLLVNPNGPKNQFDPVTDRIFWDR